jgi:hypothetical protein
LIQFWPTSMEASSGETPSLYKIKRDDYGTRTLRILGVVGDMLLLVVLWTLFSFLFERFIPFFRSGSTAYGSHQWLIRTVIVGTLWSIFMILWRVSGRNPEFDLEIWPDRIVKNRGKDSGAIYHGEISGFREFRPFGKLRGFGVRSKHHYFFIPARHPQYTEIKQKLEQWKLHAV